jgi:hypothetical protein
VASTPVPTDATSIAHEELDGGFGVWVSAATAAENAPDEARAEEFARRLSSAGVRLVLLESRTVGDEVIFPSVTHRVLRDDEGLLGRVADANRSAGIETVAVVPLFLGVPRPGEAPVEYGWDPALKGAKLTERQSRAGELPYRSLFAADARTRVRTLLDEVARVEGIDSICVSHVGFPNHMTDFRPEARLAFERQLGEAVSPWPEAIVSFGESDGEPRVSPGRLWKKWAGWRTSVVSTQLFGMAAAIRSESVAEFGSAKSVSLMANGYLDQRLRTGVNWASLVNEEEAGVGEIFDRLFLEAYSPIVTREESAAAGLRESASLEDVLSKAAQASPATVERWMVIHLLPYLDEEGRLTAEKRHRLREALLLASRWKVPVVLMDYELLTRTMAWEDVRMAVQTAP